MPGEIAFAVGGMPGFNQRGIMKKILLFLGLVVGLAGLALFISGRTGAATGLNHPVDHAPPEHGVKVFRGRGFHPGA